MLMLAGACYFAVLSHGPWQQRIKEIAGQEAPGEMPNELSEAIEETHTADLHAAIDFIFELTMRIIDGEYDDRYQECVRALLRGDTMQLTPVEGFLDFED